MSDPPFYRTPTDHLPPHSLSYVLGASEDQESAADGDAFAQIFWDAFLQRTGSGMGGVYMLIIVVIGVQLCAHATHTYIARYACVHHQSVLSVVGYRYVLFALGLLQPHAPSFPRDI